MFCTRATGWNFTHLEVIEERQGQLVLQAQMVTMVQTDKTGNRENKDHEAHRALSAFQVMPGGMVGTVL